MSFVADLIEDINVLYHLIKPIQGNNHQERLESFYKGQAKSYDSFRKRLLQGREELYNSLLEYPGDIWLDLGGGTGANLESIDAKLSQFKKFYIVDLCPSLLEIAKQRIITKGWSNVETIEANVTEFTPPEKMVDVVTFSYSLTMIPDWFVAIDKAFELLKPGGIIGVIDFYVARKYPLAQWSSHSVFSRYFWPAWFAKDNVFLSSEHPPYLHHRFESVQFTERMANLPFLPGVQVPYYIFIGRKKREIDSR
ncbi:MAG: class I SAM-dependent methyltransferase [Crocosphaera sp.]|nr:class I SAM-dependent methyltransferase [Crocosphaera sp.]